MTTLDVVCPKCGATGPCHEGLNISVKPHKERAKRARDLSHADDLAFTLGFEDGVPDYEEVEMIARLGHEEDRPTAIELIRLCHGLHLETYEEDWEP